MFHSFFCINTHPCDDSSSRSTNNKNSFLPLAFMSLNVSRCFPPLEAVVSTRCEFNVLLAVLCVCSRLSTLTPVLLFHSSSALQVRSDPGFYTFFYCCVIVSLQQFIWKRDADVLTSVISFLAFLPMSAPLVRVSSHTLLQYT